MTTTDFDYATAPMQHDRAQGWKFVRSYGEVFQAVDGVFYLTSPDAVSTALKNPETFASGPAFAFLGSPVPLVPLAIDPPEHRRFRKVLDPLFAPRVINAIEDQLRAQMAALVDAIVAKGSCDVMADIARLYPTTVFLTMFGLPTDDRDRFIHWVEIVNGASAGAEASPEVAEAGAQLFGYLQGYIDSKRATPGDDVLSHILALTGDDAWSDEEILGMCFLFTLAGLDTVTAAIGFMMHRLAIDPDLRQRVVSEPDAATVFIEEIVRLEHPAPTTVRVAMHDTEVCGVKIPEGSMCQVAFGAANRHESRGDHADAVDLGDVDSVHFGFGGGIHRCVGSHLARRELRLVIEEFHKRISDYALPEGYEASIAFPSATYHFAELPLALGAIKP
ncbi:MAG: cytochrome P450 [Acidimicrobiia bacterium]